VLRWPGNGVQVQAGGTYHITHRPVSSVSTDTEKHVLRVSAHRLLRSRMKSSTVAAKIVAASHCGGSAPGSTRWEPSGSLQGPVSRAAMVSCEGTGIRRLAYARTTQGTSGFPISISFFPHFNQRNSNDLQARWGPCKSPSTTFWSKRRCRLLLFQKRRPSCESLWPCRFFSSPNPPGQRSPRAGEPNFTDGGGGPNPTGWGRLLGVRYGKVRRSCPFSLWCQPREGVCNTCGGQAGGGPGSWGLRCTPQGILMDRSINSQRPQSTAKSSLSRVQAAEAQL
jgi:hypothetical protein